MEIAATKRYLTSILLLLILSNCSKNNEDKNRPPSPFEVSISMVSNKSAFINWTTSADPEGSTVFYDVYLNTTKLADNITEQSYAFENLLEGVNYSGEIIASDPEGNTVSTSFIFETSENQPPSLFSITVTNTNPFFSRIEWAESSDPEGGAIIYNLYLGEELLAEGISSQDKVFSDLKGLTNYSGRIEAIDIEGEITETHFSFTTDMKIYDRDLSLDNQSLVESFGEAGYNQIDGNLTIGSSQTNLTDVVDLSSLETINSVKGNLSIRNTICTSFNGLQNINITYQYSKLTIENNDELLNCNGLNSINTLYEIYISDNDKLLNLDGFSSLNSIRNYLFIVYNPSLNSLTGIQNLNSVSNTLDISNNDNLSTLMGLENITYVNMFNIIDNDNLKSLNGLNNLTYCSSLVIADNNELNDLTNLSRLTFVNTLWISDNSTLTNLTGFENLVTIKNSLYIERNSNLESIEGIKNFNFGGGSNDYHSLGIYKNGKITNLDALSNCTFNRGNISVSLNPLLADLCGLTKILSEIAIIEFSKNTFISGNAYNPSMTEIINGNCSI